MDVLNLGVHKNRTFYYRGSRLESWTVPPLYWVLL